ncbi:MAG TPA: HigA family addiction module antitoxin [Gemmatimonadota bacterium]|nr:HigA family addiction module antitoxin [Gemmatimonadota bacterium]
MSYERRQRQRAPTHPGYVVRTELEELGMSITEAAGRLGVSRPTLSQVVNENRSVSPEMALKLGRLFGNGTAVWMNMQTAHDLWAVEHDAAALRDARRVEPVHAG